MTTLAPQSGDYRHFEKVFVSDYLGLKPITSGTISIDNVQRVHELSRRCDENARRVMRVTTKCLLKLLERVTERANPPGRSLQIGGAGAASGPEAQRSRS